MNRVELDDLKARLDDIYSLKSKKLTDGAWRIWAETFAGNSFEQCEYALKTVVMREKYLPQPSDVEALISEHRAVNRVHVDEVCRSADPDTRSAFERDKCHRPTSTEQVASAWAHYFKISGSPLADRFKPRISMTKEEALTIVNQQAKKHGQIDAILPEYRFEVD